MIKAKLISSSFLEFKKLCLNQHQLSVPQSTLSYNDDTESKYMTDTEFQNMSHFMSTPSYFSGCSLMTVLAFKKHIILTPPLLLVSCSVTALHESHLLHLISVYVAAVKMRLDVFFRTALMSNMLHRGLDKKFFTKFCRGSVF